MINNDRIIPDELETRNIYLIDNDRLIKPMLSNVTRGHVNPAVAYGRGRPIGLITINRSRYVIPNGVHLRHCRKISE